MQLFRWPRCLFYNNILKTVVPASFIYGQNLYLIGKTR